MHTRKVIGERKKDVHILLVCLHVFIDLSMNYAHCKSLRGAQIFIWLIYNYITRYYYIDNYNCTLFAQICT